MAKKNKNSRKRLDSNTQKDESKKEVEATIDEQPQKKKEKQRKDDEEIQNSTVEDKSKDDTKVEVIGNKKLMRQLEKEKRDEEEAAERQRAAEKNANKSVKGKNKKQTAPKKERNGRSLSRERKSQESEMIYTQCATDIQSSKKITPQTSEIKNVQRALDNVASSSRHSRSEESEKDHTRRPTNYVAPPQNWRAQELDSMAISKTSDNKDESWDSYGSPEKKSNSNDEQKFNKYSSGSESSFHYNRGSNRTDYDSKHKAKDYRNSSYDKSPYGRQNKRFMADNTSFKNFDSFTRKSDGDHNKRGFGGNDDKDFRLFTDLLLKNDRINYDKVEEKVGDLFDAPDEYSLAHCVAEDMSMGAGIAVQFRNTFKGIANLIDQDVKTGGVAVLNKNGRFIYYLVTKNRSQGKPLLYTLWLSLHEMRKHMLQNNVTKLAIPQIGCGLDRLEWSDVKQMLEYIFHKDNISIVVYSLQDNFLDSKPKPKPKTRVVHVTHPLIDIENGTALLYLGTEDGFISEEMKSLETKFMNLSTIYMETRKSIGDVIRSEIKGEVLYGLIVKKTVKDKLNFVDLERCLFNLKPLLKKDQYYYVGLQAFLDNYSTWFLDKIITVIQSVLYDVEIYICWPKEISEHSPTQQSY